MTNTENLLREVAVLQKSIYGDRAAEVWRVVVETIQHFPWDGVTDEEKLQLNRAAVDALSDPEVTVDAVFAVYSSFFLRKATCSS